MEDKCKMPIGMRFSVIHRSFRRQMEVLLAEHELTGPQIAILGRLGYLEDRGMEANQRDVENAAHMSHASVTEILKRLEVKGFISVTQSASDRRSKCLHTTAKAAALRESIDLLDKQVFERLCQGLTDEQRRNIEPVMSVMVKNAIEMKGSTEEE